MSVAAVNGLLPWSQCKYLIFITVHIFFLCAVSVIGHLAVDAAYKNKEINYYYYYYYYYCYD
jgi:hypothetical protein